ncbi:MAG: hypothetical protein U0165_07135 [Polyangiaceae bacterium]
MDVDVRVLDVDVGPLLVDVEHLDVDVNEVDVDVSHPPCRCDESLGKCGRFVLSMRST